MPRGRPTDYEERFNHLVFHHCKLGAKDEELAALLQVTETTINNWKLSHPDFFESIKKGKLEFDRLRVEGALIHSAIGYSHASEKIFCDKEGTVIRAETTEHYPPNPTSMIFWLKNRGDNWKDKQDHEHEHKGSIAIIQEYNPKDE